tara:strand:+ start:21 stop:431 length:411 start_codon:yes stop_codon:yes gene_type:complete
MFFKSKNDINVNNLTKVAALLVHAAKIDGNYSPLEEKIIKETIAKLGANTKDLKKIMYDAKNIEENSNQILDFTKEIKNMDDQKKNQIVEELWRIIYSNNEADMYETNLMRRLAGLLYIDPKVMVEIKNKVKKEIF